MTTPREINQYVNSEIERMELEKIAKEEMEEDEVLFNAMDELLSIGRPGNDFSPADMQVFRDYNQKMSAVGQPISLNISRLLEKFSSERDIAASIVGWDGVSRDPFGRPKLDTNSDLITNIPEGHPWLNPLGEDAHPVNMEMTGSPNDPKKVREVKEGPFIDALNTPDDQPWLVGLTPSEADQKRQDMKDGIGIKYNQGKLRHAQLIPALWIRRLTEVLEYGCSEKYTMHNWKGVPAEDFLDSSFRHILDVIEGLQENGNALVRDPESQLYNIYQTAWNLLAAGYNLEKQLERDPKEDLRIDLENAFIDEAFDGVESKESSKDISLIPAWELEKLLDRRLKDDDETTIYASDIYNLIDSYTKK